MRVLILGGTGFLGSHFVEAAAARGHELTLFNRGATHPERSRGAETFLGDRDPARGNGLEQLRGRTWDAVVDTCGYVPRVVRASAEFFGANVGQYVFISSRSAYRDTSQVGADESAALATLDDPAIEEVTGATYGPLKALCEQAAESAMPGRVAQIRAGLIVGPRDPTDRFTYWSVRVARGGEVLAPGDPNQPVQFIDARDLAAFIVTVIERKQMGAFNALGPARELSMSMMLDACRAAAPASPASTARFTWVDQRFLLDQNVKPWSEMPLWIPDSPEDRGFARTSNAKAIAHGLTFRPVHESARDTLAWFNAEPRPKHSWKAGLTPERERSILEAWHNFERNNP
jgi:2'-hydroxyisoflavone reductase